MTKATPIRTEREAQAAMKFVKKFIHYCGKALAATGYEDGSDILHEATTRFDEARKTRRLVFQAVEVATIETARFSTCSMLEVKHLYGADFQDAPDEWLADQMGCFNAEGSDHDQHTLRDNASRYGSLHMLCNKTGVSIPRAAELIFRNPAFGRVLDNRMSKATTPKDADRPTD